MIPGWVSLSDSKKLHLRGVDTDNDMVHSVGHGVFALERSSKFRSLSVRPRATNRPSGRPKQDGDKAALTFPVHDWSQIRSSVRMEIAVRVMVGVRFRGETGQG